MKALLCRLVLETSVCLPEVRVSMLFYRKDILAELGLEVPQTWDDVYAIIQNCRKKTWISASG